MFEFVRRVKGKSPDELHEQFLAITWSHVEDVRGAERRFQIQLYGVNAPDNNRFVMGGNTSVYQSAIAVNVFVNTRRGGDFLATLVGLKSKHFQEALSNVLLHEMTHVATMGYIPKAKYKRHSVDDIAATETIESRESQAFRDAVEYHNDPNEVAAQIQEVANHVQLMMKTLLDREARGVDEPRDPHERLEYAFDTSSTWVRIEPFLTEKTRRKTIQAVIGHLQDTGLLP